MQKLDDHLKKSGSMTPVNLLANAKDISKEFNDLQDEFTSITGIKVILSNI